MNPDLKKKNRKFLLLILAPFAVLMLGFAFLQVPLFRLVCTQLGIAISPNAARVKMAENGRSVKVFFSGVAAGKLTVFFQPKHAEEDVRVGKIFDNEYKFVNMSDDSVFFRPVHSILPEDAAKKFTMLKCFCFNDQALGPREQRSFPVVYMLSADLDSSVQEVTLNYTLFPKERSEMQYNRNAPVNPAVVAEENPTK